MDTDPAAGFGSVGEPASPTYAGLRRPEPPDSTDPTDPTGPTDPSGTTDPSGPTGPTRRWVEPPTATDPGTLVRAMRRWSGLSQRLLAVRSEIAPTVVDRIESGRSSRPGFATLERLAHGAGLRLTLTDADGVPVPLQLPERAERDRLRDLAGRRAPEHLPAFVIRDDNDLLFWWGFGRLAWWFGEPAVPVWSYQRDRLWRRRLLWWCYGIDAT